MCWYKVLLFSYMKNTLHMPENVVRGRRLLYLDKANYQLGYDVSMHAMTLCICKASYIITIHQTCLNGSLKKKTKIVFKTDYRLMQVNSIAECSNGEHSAILSTFIKLPFVIHIYVLSIFE